VLEPNTVLEPRLVGYWTDKYLYTGDMESAGIAFRADGTGWVYWCAAAAFEIQLFTWHTAADNHLSINLDEQVSGTWHLHGQTVTQMAHDPGPPRRSDRHDLHESRQATTTPVSQPRSFNSTSQPSAASQATGSRSNEN
jgi:hypothetical protein